MLIILPLLKGLVTKQVIEDDTALVPCPEDRNSEGI